MLWVKSWGAESLSANAKAVAKLHQAAISNALVNLESMTLQTLAMPSLQTFWWFSHVFHTFRTAPYFWERHHKQLIALLNSPDEAQRGGPICTACTIIALASSKVTGAPCGFQAQSLSKTRLKCMSILGNFRSSAFHSANQSHAGEWPFT